MNTATIAEMFESLGLINKEEASSLIKATIVATVSLADLEDKAGEPLMFHAFRVASYGETDYEKVVGMLHDSVEDTAERLIPDHFDSVAGILNCLRAAFADEVVDAVQSITRLRGETYKNYVRRVGKNDLATRVKLNDLRDNTDPDRLSTDDIPIGLIERYEWAVNYLTFGEEGG